MTTPTTEAEPPPEAPQVTLKRHGFVTMPCACGGNITARSDWRTSGAITAIVRRHNRSLLHQDWRQRRGIE